MILIVCAKGCFCTIVDLLIAVQRNTGLEVLCARYIDTDNFEPRITSLPPSFGSYNSFDG